jgi:hypothetical protein
MVPLDSDIDLVTITERIDRPRECLTGSEAKLDRLSSVLNVQESVGVVHDVNRERGLEHVRVLHGSEASGGTATENKNENRENDDKELAPHWTAFR